MTHLFPFLDDDLVHVLGWTFVHTLWQGSLIALLMTGILSRIPHRLATRRYAVAAGSLLTLLISAVCTFSILYAAIPAAATGSGEFWHSTLSSPPDATDGSQGVSLTDWIARLNPFFVSIWLMGITFFAFRFVFGLAYLRHLKVNAFPPPQPWQYTLNTIVKKLGYHRAVTLAESAILRIPVVVGSIKPVVLFPVGVINQLSVEEVEAILAHEVAHLVRNDFIHNLLQSLIEMVFYYHPAVWWISANVRAERENCCDDLAVQVCGNSLTYAKALVRLEDIRFRAPALALPFAGSQNHLLNRIKRILNQPQNKSNVMEKVIATVILIGCVALLSFSYSDDPCRTFQEDNTTSPFSNAVEETDTVPGKREVTVWKSVDGKEVEMRQENGEITYLKVNGEVVDPSEYANYEAEINAAKEMAASAPLPPAPPFPAVPPAPGFPHAAPAPGVPHTAPVPPAPPVPGYSGNRTVTSTTTTTIVREKTGNGYAYRVENDGGSSNVIIDSEKGLAIIDGQEIQLDADSVFIIEKQEKTGTGMRVIRPRHLINRENFDVMIADPDLHLKMYFPDGKLPAEQLKELRIQQLRAEELSGKMEKLNEKLNSMQAKELEIYGKQWEDYAKQWGKVAEDQEKWSQYADEIKIYSKQLSDDVLQNLRSEEGSKFFYIQPDEEEISVREFSVEEDPSGNQHLYGTPGNLSIRPGSVSVFRTRGREPFRTMTSALERDGIIDPDGDYSVVLDKDKLKVNGKRMPDEVHEKYLELFEKSHGYKITGKTKIEFSSKN